jgi:hypothetical protein
MSQERKTAIWFCWSIAKLFYVGKEKFKVVPVLE